MSELNDNLRPGKRVVDAQGPSLWRRLLGHERALVVACTVIGAAVGLYRLATAIPQYAASARLYVEPADAMGNVASAGTPDAKAAAWSPPTDLLVGTEVGRLAVQLGNLQTLPCFVGVTDLPLRIVSHLDVKTSAPQSGPGQIQDLRYTCTDRKAAEQVLESIISAYEISAERWRSQRIAESLAALEKQRKLLFERLQQKQLETQRFKESNPSAFSAGDSLVLDGRLKALVEARIRAEIRRIEAEVKLATMQTMASPDPLDAAPTTRPANVAIDDAALDAWIRRAGLDAGPAPAPAGKASPSSAARAADAPPLADVPPASEAIDLDAETRYVRRLEETWGPDHPKLQAAKVRLADLERQARRHAGHSIRMAQAYFRYCRDEEERLQRAIDAQRASAAPGVGSDSAVQAQILQQVVDRSRKLLAVVCERIDHLSLESASAGMAGIKITTVVPPNAAPLVTSDQSPKLFLVPTGIGLLIGFALTYLRGSKTPVTASARTAALAPRPAAARDVVLGWVPPLPTGAGRGSQRALGTWVLREPGSSPAKALRRLGKQVLRAAARAEARCILVSSAEPREGKSVVLANLATVIAQAGRRVLLIDTNYEHPSQHVLLSDILSLGAGPAKAADEITIAALERGDIALRTQMETLWVVPAWPRPARPKEIIESNALRDFVCQSASKYDLVLIDAPALSRRDEVEFLAELADAAMYVGNAANASPQIERDILRRLDLPGLGFIVNTLPPGAVRSNAPAVPARGHVSARAPKRRSARPGPAPETSLDSEPVMDAVPGGDGESEPPAEPSY